MIRRALSGAFLYLAIASPALAGTSDAAQGKTLYNLHCSACHLNTGAGGVHFNNAVSADLRAPGLEVTYRHSGSLLLRAILKAKDQDGQPLDAPMPAWKGRLSATQVRDIVAYLKTLRS